MNTNTNKTATGKEITPELRRVALERGTEMARMGKYVHEKSEGMYRCAICNAELFSSDTKFDSGTGWPSFTDAANTENVELVPDYSHDMIRTEVACKKCGAHLGHLFNDGPVEKGGKRFCINSVCLELEKKEGK